MHPFADDSQIVYRPDAKASEQAVITTFMASLGLTSLAELNALAEADPSTFWQAVLDDIGWQWRRTPRAILDLERGKPWPNWFVGGETNVVDQLFRTNPARVALHWEGEDGERREYQAKDLRHLVLSVAGGFLQAGVGKGDRVALLLPMVPETAITFLALAAIGAISVPIFSGYGVPAVVSRLQDAEAKVLVTADGFYRRDRAIRLQETAVESAAAAPTVEKIFVVRRLGRPTAPGTLPWEALAAGSGSEPVTVRADHPLMIIYTSGTTGRPKGTVHTHGGFPIKAAQDLRMCFDLRSDDTLFWFTDMGWMMGPWSILGSGIVGAANVMYEGAPDTPRPGRLWEIIARTRTTVFGMSPTVIRSLRVHGEAPVRDHDLSGLRVLGSSGEPWDPVSWRWYFEVVGKGHTPVINYSGGTEISGGILGSFVTEPMKPCAFNGPVPGMAVRILGPGGRPQAAGVGDLAIAAPWVGITQGFWGDPDRYLETYWQTYADLWVHGDAVFRDEDGFWYVLGRSDDTINTGGKRLSPAEAESAALAHLSVREAAAIGVPDPIKGEAMVLFISLRGQVPDQAVARDEVAHLVEHYLGKALRPREVLIVSDLPRTRSGKIVRRAVRASYLGLARGDLSTLENPACLEEIAALRPAAPADPSPHAENPS